jgi:hypothetical protein
VAEAQAPGPARAAEAIELGIAGVSSLLFAASFGFNYGVGNQVTYLIPALRLLDPGLLARDWFATRTTQYHPVFAELGASLLRLDRGGWGVALAFTLAVTAAGLALHGLCRKLAGRGALAAYLLLLALLLATQTRGPALTYVFDRELQPSTLSSVCLIGAALAFTGGRTFAASVLIAGGGLLHINFALLCAPAFLIAESLLGRRDLGRRLVVALALPALAVLAFLPTLRAAAAPSPDADLGRHVYLAIRAPHHFLLAEKLGEFLPLLAWHVLALGALVPLVRGPSALPFVRLAALAAGTSAVVWVGTFAGLGSERAAAIFTWRLAPHVELLFQVLSVAAGTRALLDPNVARLYTARARTFVLVGLGAVVGAYAVRHERVPMEVVGGATLVGFAWDALARRARTDDTSVAFRSLWARHSPGLLAAAAGAVFVYFAIGPLARIPQRSSLLAGPPPEERGLFAFMRERTPKGALFLTPPDDDSLRFFGERAIVVDWKGNPALPREVLTWYRRLEDVTGRRGMTQAAELDGYDELDAERLEALRARYGFDYAVVRRGHEGAFVVYPHAFENARYVVLKVGTPEPAPASAL